jgi:hypothetical protein
LLYRLRAELNQSIRGSESAFEDLWLLADLLR